MNKKYAIKELTNYFKDYQFSFEGGRGCYLYTNFNLFVNYSTPRSEKRWPAPETFGIAGESKNHQTRWVWFIKDPKQYEPFVEMFINDQAELQAVEKLTGDIREETIKYIQDLKLEKLSNDELFQSLKYYYGQFSNLGYIAVVLRLIDRGIMLKCRKEYGEKADSIITAISVADRPGFALQEELAILKLATSVKNSELNPEKTSIALKDIHDRFTWITCGYFNEQPKALSVYEKALTEALEKDPYARIHEIESEIEESQDKRSNFLLDHSESLKTLAYLAGESGYLKDYYKFSMNAITYYSEPLFEEIAKRTGKSKEFLKDLLIDEVELLLQSKTLDQASIDERTKHYVLLSWEGNMQILQGDDSAIFSDKFLNFEKNTEEVINGRTACKGQVKGRAKVVMDSNDFHKVEKGDVLVVMNTSPDYVPILGSVAAILAEEGGITAHVSVISREMKIPAIVGIQGVTKRIKDGDMVEVDADKGVVRIITN